MKTVAIIFGGKSVEHDISIITAQQAIKAMPEGYRLLPIYITEKGHWLTGENLTKPETFVTGQLNKNPRATLKMGEPYIIIEKKGKLKKQMKIDCALLCNHGRLGEDGTLQGALEMCEIPYTSPSVFSSACCIDKVFTKMILQAESLNTLPYISITLDSWKKEKEKLFKDIATLGYPCIIKPARLGSSVGIGLCKTDDQVESVINEAFEFDDKVLVEKYISKAREFNCAALSLGNKIIVSNVQEVIKNEIYSFEEKYLNRTINNNLSVSKTLKNLITMNTNLAYKALQCRGIVRVDFLYQNEQKKLWINEINTIPGSLAFNLFDIPFSDLLEATITDAIEYHENLNDKIFYFKSNAVSQYCKSTEINKTRK